MCTVFLLVWMIVPKTTAIITIVYWIVITIRKKICAEMLKGARLLTPLVESKRVTVPCAFFTLTVPYAFLCFIDLFLESQQFVLNVLHRQLFRLILGGDYYLLVD